MPTLGYAFGKGVIHPLYAALNVFVFILGNVAEPAAYVAVPVGVYGIHRNAQLVFEGFLYVGDNAEHANGTCNGIGLGKNAVGGAANVITAAGGQVAHAHHRWLGLFGQQHLAPDHIAGQGAATRRVHAQYNSFYLIVQAGIANGLGQAVAAYLLIIALTLRDLAVGINNCNAGSVQLRVRFFLGFVFAKFHKLHFIGFFQAD